MKQTTKMSRAVGQLEKMFNVLNGDFFGGSLPTPIITVQSNPRAYGHCTVAKVWRKPDEDTYELNISAEVLDYPIEETLDTMLHEMIHLYCRENNIKETSRGGSYHNNKFKELAENCGLEVYKTENYGWNTKGGEKLIEYALSKDWSEIRIGRVTRTAPDFGALQIGTLVGQSVAVNDGKRPSSTRKLQCPCCKNSVRATKVVRIMCMDCDLQMVEV